MWLVGHCNVWLRYVEVNVDLYPTPIVVFVPSKVEADLPLLCCSLYCMAPFISFNGEVSSKFPLLASFVLLTAPLC